MKRVIGIGNALTDMLVNLESDSVLRKYLLEKGSMSLVDSKLQTEISKSVAGLPYSLSLGGSAGNTIRAMARLGCGTGFIGKVGPDTTGDFFEQALANLGVKPFIFRGSERSGKCVALISPDGERTMITHLGAALELTAADVRADIFEGFDCVYIEGYLVQNHELIEHTARTAKERGLQVAIDLASFNIVKENLDFLRALVEKYVDIVFANEDEAKYINSSDSQLYKKGEHLYGLQQARRAIAAGKPAMLTEGYMDVVTLHQFGYSSAVGVLGTAFTPEQVKRISGFTSHVELLFDGDGPGRKAALRACEMLLTRGLSCKVVLFPEGEDIDSLLRTQGTDIFEDLRRNAPEGMAFCVRCLRDMAPREAVDWAREFLRQVELPELVSRFASTLSTGLGLAESELRERIIESRGARALPRNAGGQETQPPVRTNPRDREIMTFAVRYPSSLPRLRELGAHLVLSAAWARDLWQKLEEYPVDEVVQHLDPREKRFWIRCRTGDVPPLDNEEGEFGAIRTMLDTLHLTAQSASVSAALRQGAGAGNFEADLEYLRALQETLERTHGEQH